MVRLNSNSTSVYCAAVLLTFVAGEVLADDALAWLGKMSTAMREQNYSGTFIYIHNDQVEAMKIEHRNTSKGVSERLFSLNGEPREIVRNNSVVTCIFPDSKSVVIDKAGSQSRLPTNIPTNLGQLVEHYNIAVTGEERVAERNSKIITIEPNDRYRYGYKLWVDQVSHLMVRSAVLNEEKQAVEQVLFTSLQIDQNVPDQAIEPTLLSDGFKIKKKLGQNPGGPAGVARWKASQLPPGFNLSTHKVSDKTRGVVDQLVYSDGMASVSVFIEAFDKTKKRLKGGSHMGAVHVYGTIVNGHHVTVVGEVPSDTVKLIGKSITANE